MKFIRYAVDKTEYRGVTDGETIKRINGTIFHDYSVSTDVYNIEDVRLLAPVIPSKIICVNNENNKPSIYFKPPSSIIATGENVIKPANVDKLYASLEIAIVIGKKCRNISEKSVNNFVLGYTTAINVAGETGSDMTNMAYDTFTPIAPIINERLDNCYDNIIFKINDNNIDTKLDIASIPFIVSHVSGIMTLLPGDIILTNVTERINVCANDALYSKCDGIGVLSAHVKES